MLESIAKFLAANFLAMLMLSVGLRTETAIVRDLFKRSRLLLWALLIVWVAVPLFSLAVLVIVRPVAFDAATLMVMAICPGVPFVLFKSKRSHGHPRTSLLVLLATALTALVMVPLWAAFLNRFTPVHVSFGPVDVAKVLLPTVFVPYVVGRIIQTLSPRIAKPLAKVAQALFVIGLVLLLAIMVIKKLPNLGALDIRDLVAALLIPFGAAFIGLLATRKETLDQRIAITYATALGNPALALAIMARSYSAKAISLVLAFVLVRALAMIPFSIWFKRHRHGDEARTHSPGPLAHAHST